MTYPAHASFGEEFSIVRTVGIVAGRATDFFLRISVSRSCSLDRMCLALWKRYHMVSRSLCFVAAYAPFVNGRRQQVRVITSMGVMTITASSDDHRVDVFLRVISLVVTSVAEFGRVADKKFSENRSVWIVAAGAFAFRNRWMGVRILKIRFLMAAEAEIGDVPNKFYAVFLVRVFLVLYYHMAGITPYGQRAVTIL